MFATLCAQTARTAGRPRVERNLRSRLQEAREARRRITPYGADGPAPDDPEESEPMVIDLRTLRSVRETGQRALADVPLPDDGDEPGWSWTGSGTLTASMATLARRQAAARGEPILTTNPS